MDNEIHEFLLKHLQGIMNNDIASYQSETTAEESAPCTSGGSRRTGWTGCPSMSS